MHDPAISSYLANVAKQNRRLVRGEIDAITEWHDGRKERAAQSELDAVDHAVYRFGNA